MKGNVQTPQNF